MSYACQTDVQLSTALLPRGKQPPSNNHADHTNAYFQRTCLRGRKWRGPPALRQVAVYVLTQYLPQGSLRSLDSSNTQANDMGSGSQVWHAENLHCTKTVGRCSGTNSSVTVCPLDRRAQVRG